MDLKLFLMADFPRFGFPSGAAAQPQCCRAPGLALNPTPTPSTPRESSWFPRTLRTSLQDRQKERCSKGFFVFLLPKSPWLLVFCLFEGFVFAPKMFSIWVHPCAVFSQLFTILLLPCLSWPGWLLLLQSSDSSCLPQGVFFLLRQGYVAHSAQCKLLPSFPGASQQQNAALGPLGRLHSVPENAPCSYPDQVCTSSALVETCFLREKGNGVP